MTVIYTKYNAENNFVRTIYVKYGVKNIQRGLEIWVWKSTEFWNGKCVRTLYPALVQWWHWQFWRTILTSLMLSPVVLQFMHFMFDVPVSLHSCEKNDLQHLPLVLESSWYLPTLSVFTVSTFGDHLNGCSTYHGGSHPSC